MLGGPNEAGLGRTGDRTQRVLKARPGLHLHKDKTGAAAREDVDFAHGRAQAPRQNTIPLEPQGQARQRLGPMAPSEGFPAPLAPP